MRHNDGMRVLCALLLLPLAAWAQAPAPAVREPAGPPRQNQKIEHIIVEDSGNRIEEVRVGGQSQSVTVQPKGAPAYEMRPSDMARSRPADRREGLSGGTNRVWNIVNF